MARQDGVRGEGLRAKVEIPDKLYFRIGEVARMCAVPSYVLRFWEREFPQLRPGKGGTGQRLYRRRDVEMALRVRSLLYEEGYTIPGARQTLREAGRAGGAEDDATGEGAAVVEGAALRELRAELEEIARMLAGGERRRPVMVGEGRRRPERRAAGVDAGTMPLFAVLEGAGPDGSEEGK